MQDKTVITAEYRHSWADNGAVLLGGAVGGYLGLLIVAELIMPNVLWPRSPADSLCCGFGVIAGYVPGIVARIGKASRLAGMVVAMVSGAFFTAIAALILGAGVSC